jgi:hypothetical protein
MTEQATASTCHCWTMRHIQFGTDPGTVRLIFQELIEKVRAKGCMYFRAIDEKTAIYVEGWVLKPDDQGPADVRTLLDYKQI